MRVSTCLAALPLVISSTVAAAGWSFQDGTVSVSTKGAGVGGGSKQSLSATSELPTQLNVSPTDTLKLILNLVDGTTGKRPHQAFLTLHEPATGLEESFPLSVKESGKARIDIAQKDIPFQFLTSKQAVTAKLVIGSFGSSAPYLQNIFKVKFVQDSTQPIKVPEAPLRYGKLAEINHIFRADPKSPPVIISSVFTLAVVFTLPILLGGWLALGANFNHFGKAFGAAPISHALFFGSIAAIEGVFFLYYTSWNLFQTLPVAGVLGVVAIVSGSRALTEVQERRIKGER